MTGFIFGEPLHYLVHEADGEKVAHCLDMDLVASGVTAGEATERLNDVVRFQVNYALKNGTQASLRSKAPARYWEMFSEASEKNTKSYRLQLHRDLAPVSVEECHLTYLVAEVFGFADEHELVAA